MKKETRYDKAKELLNKIRKIFNYSRDYGVVEMRSTYDTYKEKEDSVRITFYSWGESGDTFLKLLTLLKEENKLKDWRMEATDLQTEGRTLKFIILF